MALFLSISSLAQSDSSSSAPNFRFSASIGSMTGLNYLKNEPDAAFVFNPSIESGKIVSIHAGALVLSRDMILVDSTHSKRTTFIEVGLSARQTFADDKLYAGGGYYFLRNSGGEGHRVVGQLGVRVSKFSSFYIEHSKIYAKDEDFTGSLLNFGISLQF